VLRSKELKRVIIEHGITLGLLSWKRKLMIEVAVTRGSIRKVQIGSAELVSGQFKQEWIILGQV
jgi:hypothetical protein